MPKPVTFEMEVGKGWNTPGGRRFAGAIDAPGCLELDITARCDGSNSAVHLDPNVCSMARAVLGACGLKPGQKCGVKVTIERTSEPVEMDSWEVASTTGV